MATSSSYVFTASSPTFAGIAIDAVSLDRQRQRMEILACLLSIAALTCSCAVERRVGIGATDDELLSILAALAQQGTHALCDPRLLEQRLAIRIEYRIRRNELGR